MKVHQKKKPTSNLFLSISQAKAHGFWQRQTDLPTSDHKGQNVVGLCDSLSKWLGLVGDRARPTEEPATSRTSYACCYTWCSIHVTGRTQNAEVWFTQLLHSQTHREARQLPCLWPDCNIEKKIDIRLFQLDSFLSEESSQHRRLGCRFALRRHGAS